MKKLLAVLFPFVLFLGCAATPARPPSALESKLFDIQTNFVPVVVTTTNTVWQTNTTVQTVTLTNTVGVVVPVTVTNFVPVQVPQVVTITNTIPVYEYVKGSNAAGIQATAGSVGNIAAPGVGGPIASALVGLLLTGWAWVRSSRATKTAANSAQVIETARELLKTLPNGQTLDNQLVTWMQQHQAEQGVLNDVLKLLQQHVNNDTAKGAAQQIADAVAALNTKSS